jgi:fatty-acyl-CoA synthase
MSPGRVALLHDDVPCTYAELSERVDRAARALAAAGVRAGDRVAYLGPNHPAFVETLFATGALGASFVPLNTRLAAPELAYILADCGAAALVCDARAEASAAALMSMVAGGLRGPQGEASRAGLAGCRLVRTEELAAADPAPVEDLPVDQHETCMILYTSGTTGRPKGVMLTHANIAWNSVNLLLDVDLAGDEVTLVSAPMFHVGALNQTVLPTFLKGGTSVLVPAFDPAATLDLIEKHRVTFLFGVPAMFQAIALVPRFESADLSSVRSMICGGAPVPEPMIETYQRRGLTFMQGYGMTESAPGALFLRADDSVRKIGSAGTPAFFTDVAVVRPDRSPVGPGEPGEVIIQGPNVMAGYWGRPADTADVLDADGWLRTGDVAVLDDDGYAYIRDRIKDMIISGGENIYPAEVEDALYGHPAVAECAVIGVPDERWGEVGRAVVVLRPGMSAEPADVLAFLDGRIARYKIPKSVVFADSLPRTASGKVVKRQLRERL